LSGAHVKLRHDMTIVPRWEWRTFGDSFGEAEDRFASLSPERAQDSDDLYLLSRYSDASLKVRDGLMDVKQLQSVNDDGLEQWKPVLKASFPLSAADLQLVLDTVGVDVAPPEGAGSLEELVEGLARASADLTAVMVHKHREHYMIGGAMAEVSTMRTDAGSTRTIAVESEDPARVVGAVAELGLASRHNVNVARGLKTLVGFGARRFAVIDVGTNSIKFHVGERRADGEWLTVVDRADVTRLGEGLDETGKLGPEPIGRSVKAIAAMAEEARQDGVEAIAAVGTAGLRIASNAAEFIDAVHARCNVTVEVISGEEEARLAYRAATAGLGRSGGSIVVFDTGGGSSQFTFSHGDDIDEQFSVNVGAVRYTERFGLGDAVSEDTVAAARAAIADDLARLDGRGTLDAIVGMGGANTNLAAVKHELAKYDPDVVQGTVLDCEEIDRQIELYRTRSAEQRREIVGLQPNRAEVILAGACIVRTVLAKLGRDSLVVSDRALRHGLLVERFGR
jgi:exopolyphosphatase/guanosine-5'-triphosphate,3'-diphosphate pyrophosphatase